MGQVIPIRERVVVTKSARAMRMHQERERALAHAHMMMLGALVTSSLMMVALTLLALVR